MVVFVIFILFSKANRILISPYILIFLISISSASIPYVSPFKVILPSPVIVTSLAYIKVLLSLILFSPFNTILSMPSFLIGPPS